MHGTWAQLGLSAANTPSAMGPFDHCTLVVSLESYALFSVRGPLQICMPEGYFTRHPETVAYRLMYGLYAGFCRLESGICKKPTRQVALAASCHLCLCRSFATWHGCPGIRSD